MDSENSSAIKNDGKENEELTNSMKKLQVEESSLGSGQAAVSNFKRRSVIVIVVGMAGEKCTYYQIGDVFVCENTSQVHVCDDNCREVVIDPTNELWVCTIPGHCFDKLLSPKETESDAEQ
ncbi:hypothetical protein FF1_010278 [Malus domestica]